MSVTTDIKKIIPKSVETKLRYAYEFSVDYLYEHRLKNLGVKKNKMLILGTIARSGTHYTKFLLANYLKVLSGDLSGPVTPEEMGAMFPNNWHLSYLNVREIPFGKIFPDEYKEPTNLLELIGLDDFTRSHALYQRCFWDESPVLHLYRNPLDYSVSYFHYMHKNRVNGGGVKDPFEVLEQRFENYVAMYKSYEAAARSGKSKILRLSYEDMKCHPVPCLRIILRWLGIEPLEEHLQLAAENSEIKKIQSFEKSGEKVNPTANLSKGMFARNGGIGQWQEYFSNDQIVKARAMFKNVGISLDDFTLEV